MFLITVPSRHCLVTFLLLSILQRTRNEGISVTNLCLDIHVCAHLIVNLQFDRGYFDTPTICSTDAQYPSEHLPLLTKYLLQFSGDDCKKVCRRPGHVVWYVEMSHYGVCSNGGFGEILRTRHGRGETTFLPKLQFLRALWRLKFAGK